MINQFTKKIFIGIAIIVGLFVLFLLFTKPNELVPQIVSTDPSNNLEDVLDTKQISINFDKKINEKSKVDLSVTFSPNVNYDSTWLTNTLVIIPKSNLANNTKYTVNISYKNKEIYTFSFTTQIFSQEDIIKYGPLQSQDDYNYGQALKDLINKYPFYTYMPIKTKGYIVDFDVNKNKFIITLLQDNLTQTEKENLIKDALINIKKVGAPEPIQYYTYP